jgi:hypothetical protein
VVSSRYSVLSGPAGSNSVKENSGMVTHPHAADCVVLHRRSALAITVAPRLVRRMSVNRLPG